MTDVVRISGAPGCGKTTRLMDYVAEERDAGRSIGDLYYVTFSRSAVEETQEKLSRAFPDVDEDDAEKRGRTFHSLALRLVADDLLEPNADQIITERGDADLYTKFATRWGMEYSEKARGAFKPGSTGGAEAPDGNRFFSAVSQLQLRMMDPERCIQLPIQLPRSARETARLVDAWREFKAAGRPGEGLPLYEHNDYVTECVEAGYAPDADVLFIDEFQDLSPLEYKLYKTWRDSGRIDTIYIAGDANQSIYGSFRAARPEFFRETPVDREDRLRASYRCPSEIVSVARGVLDSDPDPAASHGGYQARTAGGAVIDDAFATGEALAQSVADAAQSHETDDGNRVFLLARTNYQVSALTRTLRSAGIPHQRLGSNRDLWDKKMGRLLAALRALRGARAVFAKGAETLLRTASGKRERRMNDTQHVDARPHDDQPAGLPAATVWSAFPECDTVGDIIPLLDVAEWRQTELQSALGRTDAIEPNHVKVGTIHSAKGLEAPCVYLFAESSPRVLEEYRTGDASEEHRLHYVGVTRASETLHIVRDYFGTDTFPPFELATPRDAAEVVA